MENLIYPDGIVIYHNGPDVSVASGNGYPTIPQIYYDSADHHVKVYIDLITSDEAINMPWPGHNVVFMGPPIESVSVRWNGQAADFFDPTVNILSKGGPGTTTGVAWSEVADMFTGRNECLEVEFDLIRSKPAGLATSGHLSIDCKMPYWVSPN